MISGDFKKIIFFFVKKQERIQVIPCLFVLCLLFMEKCGCGTNLNHKQYIKKVLEKYLQIFYELYEIEIIFIG